MAIKKIKPVTKKAEDTKLIKKAEENTTVERKDGKYTVEKKDGLPLDHAMKQDPKNLETDKIGLSKGVTVNLGDYQSMRVDCWLTTSLKDGETEQQALNRISTIIDDRVNLEVDKVKSNM